MMSVGLVDGTILNFSSDTLLSEMLPEQNTLRETYGLSPLPDPASVTHENPALMPMNP